MTDDRIAQHLRQQAEGIALTPADPAGAMRRGTRRRTRRRAGLLGSVAVVGLLATSVAVRDNGRDQTVDLAEGATASASTYDWSVVTPQVGLGYGSPAVQLADGSVYSLSTEPGPYKGGNPARALYRSTDGAEWSEATLPAGVRTSDLSGSGDTLYSVGTAPSGGIVVSSSSDGARSWAQAALGDDLAQLEEEYGNKLVLGQAAIAAKDASHVVVSIAASTSTDLSLYKPEYANGDYGYEWNDEGVRIYENPKSECEAERLASGAPASTTVANDPEVTSPDKAIDCRAAAQSAPDTAETVASFTYDELGITGALRDHVGGKAYSYVTDDGATFQPVDLPADLELGSVWGWVAAPVATADGYRLVLAGGDADGSTTTVLRSTDGHAWEVATTFPSSFGQVGTLGGAAAITLWTDDGGELLKVERADGRWDSIDLTSAVAVSDGERATVYSVSFGPLGLAAVIGVGTDDGGSFEQYLVHSTDGSNLQVQPVADVLDTGGQVNGIVVTADAIAARVTEPGSADDSIPGVTRVLVGTPTS